MKNPYEVLGISESATNEEVRDAYRKLAKKYHPDNYADSPLADMAEEKMKEINYAYDEILRIRAEKKNNNQRKEDGYQRYNADYGSRRSEYSKVRQAINANDFKTAEAILNQVDQLQRDGEWFFLKGCILLHQGYHFDAIRYIDRACELEPGNEEFATLRDNLRTQTNAYGDPSSRQSGGCSICDICSFLICLDCMCR